MCVCECEITDSFASLLLICLFFFSASGCLSLCLSLTVLSSPPLSSSPVLPAFFFFPNQAPSSPFLIHSHSLSFPFLSFHHSLTLNHSHHLSLIRSLSFFPSLLSSPSPSPHPLPPIHPPG